MKKKTFLFQFMLLTQSYNVFGLNSPESLDPDPASQKEYQTEKEKIDSDVSPTETDLKNSHERNNLLSKIPTIGFAILTTTGLIGAIYVFRKKGTHLKTSESNQDDSPQPPEKEQFRQRKQQIQSQQQEEKSLVLDQTFKVSEEDQKTSISLEEIQKYIDDVLSKIIIMEEIEFIDQNMIDETLYSFNEASEHIDKNEQNQKSQYKKEDLNRVLSNQVKYKQDEIEGVMSQLDFGQNEKTLDIKTQIDNPLIYGTPDREQEKEELHMFIEELQNTLESRDWISVFKIFNPYLIEDTTEQKYSHTHLASLKPGRIKKQRVTQLFDDDMLIKYVLHILERIPVYMINFPDF